MLLGTAKSHTLDTKNLHDALHKTSFPSCCHPHHYAHCLRLYAPCPVRGGDMAQTPAYVQIEGARMMAAQKLEVAAGVKRQLQMDAKRIPGMR